MSLVDIDAKILRQFELIDSLLNDLENDTAPEPREDVYTHFAEIFYLMLNDSKDGSKLLADIKQSSNTELLNKYLSRIKKIEQYIFTLDQNKPKTKALLTRIYDNIPNKLLENAAQADSKTFYDFFNHRIFHEITNTVVVRTWGTVEEQGTGLNNIVRQKIKGEGVGHASVTMYLKADEEGCKAINQYCMHPDGSIKIPYKLKTVNNQLVYEVYWSYWPERLETLKDDIITERSGISYTRAQKAIESLPEEVVDKELGKKNLGNREIRIAAPAIKNMTQKEIDPLRQKLILNKIQQKRLENDIHTLENFYTNYLKNNNGEKAFMGKKSNSSKNNLAQYPLRANFLNILNMYKGSLKNKSLAYKVCLKGSASLSEIIELKSNVQELFSSQKSTLEETKEKGKMLIQKLGASYKQVQEIKDQINEVRDRQKTEGNLSFARFNDIKKRVEKHFSKDEKTFNFSEDDVALIQQIEGMEDFTGENFTNKQALEVLEKISVAQEDIWAEQRELVISQELKLIRLKEESDKKSDLLSEIISDALENYQLLNELPDIIEEAQPTEVTSEIAAKGIDSSKSYDDILSDNIIEGAPNHEVALGQMNVIKMLECASSLADTTHSFQLAVENCSTTSLKLLSAGTEDPVKKELFQPSKPDDGGKAASNRFLSNPQAVFSAVSLAKKIDARELDGKETVKKIQEEQNSRKNYNRFLNKAVQLGDQKSSSIVKLIAEFIAHPAWYVYLAQDLEPLHLDTYQTRNDGLFYANFSKVLNHDGKGLQLIHDTSAKHALYRMKEMMELDPTAIPFYDKTTAHKVDTFYYSLIKKDPAAATDEEFNLKLAIEEIHAERDRRIEVIKDALIMQNSPTDKLNQTKPKTILDEGKLELTSEERKKIFISNFLEKYKNMSIWNQYVPTKIKRILENNKIPVNERVAQFNQELQSMSQSSARNVLNVVIDEYPGFAETVGLSDEHQFILKLMQQREKVSLFRKFFQPSNLMSNLTKLNNEHEKINRIVQYINDNPNSQSAKAYLRLAKENPEACKIVSEKVTLSVQKSTSNTNIEGFANEKK